MTSPDDQAPDPAPADPAAADSAMASGSDAGGAGEHLGAGDLTADERRLLEALGADGPPDRGDDEVADDAVVRAAEDEAPLPGAGGDQGDGLSARFRPPPAGG